MKDNRFEQLHNAYRAVFNTPDGEEVLKHLCKTAFVYDTSYASGDPYETVHREGMRRVVLSILRFVERDPAEIYKLINQETTNE
jgi:hypothetical protein